MEFVDNTPLPKALSCINVVEGASSFLSSFPAVSKAHLVNASGVRSEIICSSYDDYHFVNISQMDKMGTVVRARATKVEGLGEMRYEMTTLLGKRDDPLLDVYARQIIEKIAVHSHKPLILGIALVQEGRDAKTFQDILNKLFELNTWHPSD